MTPGAHIAACLLSLLLAHPAGARIPLSTPLTHKGYDRIATKDGVNIYKHRRAKIIRLAAEGRFNAPPARVRQALLGYAHHAGTIKRVVESRILSQGDHWLLVYQRWDLPFISDRDFTMRVSWGEDGTILWTSFKNVPSEGPPARRGVVRLPLHRGSWQLKPILGGKATQARYELSLDLGGWIPRWLTRTSKDMEVPELFAAIRRMIRSQH